MSDPVINPIIVSDYTIIGQTEKKMIDFLVIDHGDMHITVKAFMDQGTEYEKNREYKLTIIEAERFAEELLMRAAKIKAMTTKKRGRRSKNKGKTDD